MTLGEFELIKKLTDPVRARGRNVMIGVGDDCAVMRTTLGKYLLASVDSQVDGVHFRSKQTPPERIGRKAVAVALSDIAAMGGEATSCLVSLFLPKKTDDDFVSKVYEGIRQECSEYSISIVGGNISRAPAFAIDISVFGEISPRDLLLRSGAKAGDMVLVTGSLGDAAAGFELLRHKRASIKKSVRDFLVGRQEHPAPRTKEGLAIARSRKASAMIDISDGIAQDMLHIGEQSGVGVILYEEKLPLSRELKTFCKAVRKNPADYALAGGEDYELLFTAPPSRADALIRKVKKETGTAVSVIGEITRKEKGNWIILTDGRKRRLKPDGWNHLRI